MRLLGILFAVLLALGCRNYDQAGGLDGLHDPQQDLPDLPAIMIAPDGTQVVPGTIDQYGYKLPLDVGWPKVRRTLQEQPVPREAMPLGDDGFAITRIGPDDGHTHNETSIDADGSTVVAGWNQATGSTIVMGWARSGDSGDTWTVGTFADHDTLSDPVVAAGGDGRWYYAYIARGGATGSDFEVFVRHSTDDGLTWSSAVPVALNADFDDKPYMHARGEQVLVAWAQLGSGPARIYAAVSEDGGESYIRQTIVNPVVGNGNGACPLIAPNGDFYVFWRDSFQQFLWMAKSTDAGRNWEPDVQVTPMVPLPTPFPPGYRIINIPAAKADPVTGDIVIVWNDQAFGDGDILAVRSQDNGTTWSDPVRVNDDDSGHPQFFPWLDFDDGGKLHVIWYDARGNGTDLDVYYASSDDAGATFSANQRVTANAFTPVLPWEGGLASFIGDYNGIAVTEENIYGFFQDSTRGIQDVYVAIKPNDTVVLTHPEVLSGWGVNFSILDLIPFYPLP